MARTLTPAEVRQILTELVHALADRGEAATVHVIGGAAVALSNPERTSTADIDGLVRPVDARDVIEDLQREWGLEADWFTWHAQGLQPPVGGAEMWREVLRDGPVVLYAATTESLLAMKLHAARAKDMSDIEFLLDACGIGSVEAAQEIYERYYPGELLSVRAEARVIHALELSPPDS
jgi:hypothetical protein